LFADVAIQLDAPTVTTTGNITVEGTGQSYIGGTSGLRFDADDTGNTIYQVTAARDLAITTNTGDIKLRAAAAGDYALVITDDGFVGINRTIPPSKDFQIQALNSGATIIMQIMDDGGTQRWEVGKTAGDDAYQWLRNGSATITTQITAEASAVTYFNHGGSVGIGTTTAPHGGVGAAKLAIEGTNASFTTGPHIQVTTASDDRPLFQLLSYQHDSIEMYFDAYNDGSPKSSDVGSNFRVRKASDLLHFEAETGITAGSAATFLTSFRIEADADVLFSPAAARVLQFRDSAIWIASRADGYLDLTADTGTRIGDGGTTHYTLISNVGALSFVGTSSGLILGEVWVKDNTSTTTLNSTGSKVQFVHFDTNGASKGVTPDNTTDDLTIVTAGLYRVTMTMSIENQAGASHDIEVAVWKNNGATELTNVHSHRTLGAGTDIGSITIEGYASLSASDTLEIWLDTDRASNSDVIVSDCNLHAELVGG
jgi:hypothetical protein